MREKSTKKQKEIIIEVIKNFLPHDFQLIHLFSIKNRVWCHQKKMWPKIPIISSCFQVDLRGLHLPFGTMAVAINSEPAEVKKLRSWKTMAPLKGESDDDG